MNKNMEKLIKSAESVPDTRRSWGHLLHKLSDILVIAFCAIICGAQTYRDLEIFGNAKETWLSNYLSLPNGIPNADTFERIFEMLDSNVVANKMRWLLQTDEIAGKIIAFDGKTMRGSKCGDNRGLHVVSAFLTDAQIVLGEITCDEKSNEITVIPELLDMVNVEKSIVTIDAMGTQTKIAEKIIAQKADYCLALKGNQSNLHDDVRLYFETETIENATVSCETGHGRTEQRAYFLETEIDWLYGRERWAGLRAIGAVKSTIEIRGKRTVETRYFLTSLTNIDDFSRAVRAHWGIENRLHWHLDVTFGEDSSRIRNKNAAGVWNVLRKLALEYLKKQAFGGASLKSLRKLAGWDSNFLERVIFTGALEK
jgi:predicted transposase YbfD/YdcC